MIHTASLLLRFTVLEHRLRDQGTFLGFLWTLLNPLFFFLVLYAIFGPAFSPHLVSFGSYLLSGLIVWNFFSLGTQTGTSIHFRRPQFLRTSRLHPIFFIVGGVGSILIASILETLLASFVLTLLGQDGLSFLVTVASALFITAPIVVGSSVLLALASTVLLDALYLWALALRIGFFATPIFFPISVLSENIRTAIFFNPLLYPLSVARASLPEPAVSLSIAVTASLAIGGLLLTAGLLLASRFRDRLTGGA